MVVATGETSGWHYYSLWMMCHLFSAKQPIPTLEIAAGIIRHSANSPNSDNSIMWCLTLICLRLSICLHPSICIYLCGLSVSVDLRLSICLRPSICICLCGLCVSETCVYLSVCVYLCGLAAKLFCATSYFPVAAPSKSPVKQHTDTNHSVMSVRWFAGTFRSSAGGLTFR